LPWFFSICARASCSAFSRSGVLIAGSPPQCSDGVSGLASTVGGATDDLRTR
jgi:hypothetical protein